MRQSMKCQSVQMRLTLTMTGPLVSLKHFNYIFLNFDFLLIQTILIMMMTRKILQQGQVQSSKAVSVPVTLSALGIYFIYHAPESKSVSTNKTPPQSRDISFD